MNDRIIDFTLLQLEKDGSTPLHICFREKILSLLRTGQLKVGDKLPSRNQIQKNIGISSTPYHKAINELIQDGILTAQHGKGVYVKSLHGRRGPERTVTLLLAEPEILEHIAFTEVINGILDILVPHEYNLKFTFFNPSGNTGIREKMQSSMSVGVIVPFYASRIPEHFKDLKELNLPIVFLGQGLREISPYSVETDSSRAFSVIPQLSAGRELDLLYIGQPVKEFYRRHSQWIREGCSRQGIKLKTLRHYACEFNQDAGAAIMKELLSRNVSCDLIIAEDDYVACGVLSALAEYNRKIPLLPVGGFLKHLYPLNSFPAIDLNYRKIGRTSAELLLSILNGAVPEQKQVTIESELYQ